jgi:hypothetical protein
MGVQCNVLIPVYNNIGNYASMYPSPSNISHCFLVRTLKITSSSFFFFFEVLGFELRALCLLDQHSIA